VIIGFVSLILGVINLFPFLPLDGGHVLWSVAEKLRGARISTQAMWKFSSVGIVLLVSWSSAASATTSADFPAA
jgi:regulator of sigma E protease